MLIILLYATFFCAFTYVDEGSVTDTGSQLNHKISFEKMLSDKRELLSEWIVDTTVSNVAFHHMITVCNGKKVVLLKMTNTSRCKMRVSWKELFKTQHERHTEGFNGTKTLIILPGETFQSDCKDNRCKECLIMPTQVNPSYGVEISDFQYTSINVSRI